MPPELIDGVSNILAGLAMAFGNCLLLYLLIWCTIMGTERAAGAGLKTFVLRELVRLRSYAFSPDDVLALSKLLGLFFGA
jgi:hypothetical protein